MFNYTNNFKLSFEQMVSIEEKIYENESGCSDISPVKCDIDKVLIREKKYFHDKEYNMPQNIFLIKSYHGHIIVGRKLRSVLFFEKKINAINCSMITADMLLGIFDSNGQSNRDVWIEYFPFEKAEKRNIFDSIKYNTQIEITFPFVYREYETGLEEITSPKGWDIYPEKVKYLGYGEEHLRQYSINVLRPFLLGKKSVVFDPACSTGEFLYSLKQEYPYIKTIGQDLSLSMIEYARTYVDEIYCGDSILTPVKDYSVDLLVFRFLNSEVVSQEYAYQLFNALILKLNDTGNAVLFGHTPVLLNSEDFRNAGYDVLQNIGYNQYRDCIFQYYIIRRKQN